MSCSSAATCETRMALRYNILYQINAPTVYIWPGLFSWIHEIPYRICEAQRLVRLELGCICRDRHGKPSLI